MPPKFFKPQSENTTDLPVRLILCFDGTGDIALGNDSIYQLYKLSKEGPVSDSKGIEFFQFVRYFEGPATGNKDKTFLLDQVSDKLDIATGRDCEEILRKGYKTCCKYLNNGGDRNEIFIFGFSRGAFIARALASFLQCVGLLKPEWIDKCKKENFHKLLDEYESRVAKPHEKGLPAYSNNSPRVRLLGVFDTVKAVQRMNYVTQMLTRTPVDFQMDAPDLVDNFRHALALNESRTKFVPSMWEAGKGSGKGTYEQAWFFGHHHDVGGGAEREGLALYPLQWILGAAKDCGMVCNEMKSRHSVLFKGSEKEVRTPHTVSMKLFDMIDHHKIPKFRLRLNKPVLILSPVPRNYREFRPDIAQPSLKVYLHPSAYLAFDVNSSFRLQVAAWKHLKEYMDDRHKALEGVEPWWEDKTVEGILHEASAVEYINILIYAPKKTVDWSLIATKFGPIKVKSTDIWTHMEIENNKEVRLYRSDGTESREVVEDFLVQHKDDTAEPLHAIWYFLDCLKPEMDEQEKEFFTRNFQDIPIHVVVVNSGNAVSWTTYLTRKPIQVFKAFSSRILPVDIHTAEDKKIEEVKKEVKRLNKSPKDFTVPVKSYIRTDGTPEDTIKALFRQTSAYLDEEARIAGIKAQRAAIRPTVALANEETIRAYTIWYMNKYKNKPIEFGRNQPGDKSFSLKLIEPILATFNMRCAKDDITIKSMIGNRWSKLDQYEGGLLNKNVPADLVLMCMVDTTMVMIYACYLTPNEGPAVPFTLDDIKKACKAYKESKQEKMHDMIKSLLTDDEYKPVGKSFSDLQMKFIRAVIGEMEEVKNELGVQTKEGNDEDKWFYERWYEGWTKK